MRSRPLALPLLHWLGRDWGGLGPLTPVEALAIVGQGGGANPHVSRWWRWLVGPSYRFPLRAVHEVA